jgi:hypothetical protein
MHESKGRKLRPAVDTSTAVTTVEPAKVSPALWPLVGYFGLGTILLFLMSQLDRLATAIMPGDTSSKTWHEGSAGWIALYPATLPILLVREIVLLAVAIPARVVVATWNGLRRALEAAWSTARAAIARIREVLREAMRVVRRSANVAIQRVRATLARWFPRSGD